MWKGILRRALVTTKGNHLEMSHLLCQEPELEVRGGSHEKLHAFDPLTDPRWEQLLSSHPDASLFHSPAWLRALQKTYGYQPIGYTTCAPHEVLDNAIVFCSVESWLTGRRLVSLPFSDYCAPLVRNTQGLQGLVERLEGECQEKDWRYVEIRPLESFGLVAPNMGPILTYTLHRLNLRPDLETLFVNFHKNSIQRKIRRAEREALRYEEGSSEELLDIFYRLLLMTRQRHMVPPQPREWFCVLMNTFGEDLKIRIAFKDKRPVAGMLTIRYKDTMVYKYGGSDTRFNRFGGMHLLYWRSIQDAKKAGLRVFDLGRSDADQAGLIKFKSRWGSTETTLTYLRITPAGNSVHIFDPSARTWETRVAKRVFGYVPPSLLSVMGRILYKHIG